ncbi:hypothetical protein A2397_02845 [Candidatus Amesbacteria bacterium RIFOXYB1_FULL_44_23]|uniref:Glycosyl transferase family 1 domain-containing protein n=1 Tax=Candidatus Amesbacteria bacterium RIFOXYB1_FULL_44_23 TaxID=1797263 RepID=A0A1F4ZUX8_9BACT|nr:MAG: hypothetical protein A2397_02845 [Candidatus Amesbacteria bacterium RIFOXYB1_FULL_44_23]
MKILFSLTYYSPYVSGLTNYVKTLAGELATKKGVEVSVLCMRHDPELSEMEIVDGVSVVRAKPDFALSKGYVSLDWFKKSWENVRNCDVVVVNLPQAEGLVPALMARLLRKRLISVYHARVELRGGLMDKLIELVLEGLNSEIMMLSHKVITYTDVYAKTLRVYKKIRHKIYSVYPPIKLPRENKALSKTIRYKIPPGTKAVIGVAARLAEDKGFENIIKVIPYLEKRWGVGKVVVLVAGSMSPVGEKKYRERILKMLNNCNGLIFLGEIRNDLMGSFYNNIDLLIVPSILESFGIVQAEAMMMGKPVVTSNLPGANVPVQRTGMGKLVPPGEVEKLAEAIEAVWSQKKEYKEMSTRARKEFAIEKTICFYEELLRGLK